jgi:serine/threonine protein phosphatase PrpC
MTTSFDNDSDKREPENNNSDTVKKERIDLEQQEQEQWHLQSEQQLTLGQTSFKGLKAQNEDAIGIRIPTGIIQSHKGSVAIIADGVSAAEAGKEASETCVRNFLSDYYSTPDTWSVKQSTTKVLTALNRWLYSQGQRFSDAQKGYISTLSCIIFKSNTAHIFHVGDSRIYRLRDGDLEQLTRDHTTAVSATQSYLSRAMGLDVKLDVDYRSTDLEQGDLYFLSTDGIHDFISDQQLRAHLKPLKSLKTDNFEENCQQLVELALQQKSNDNVSCQIIRIDQLPCQSLNDVHQKLTDLPFPPDLDISMSIDGLRIEKVLHSSNRSQLYKVVDIESGEAFCMKTPSVNYNDDAAYIERFILEGWIGHRINNPHVLKIAGFNRPKKYLYYLTEYIDGSTLEQWSKENPEPPVQDVIVIIQQVLKGLRAFHRRETIHQDLKPGNIMLDRYGEAKIIDFGSCHVKAIAEIATPLERDGILGTATYAAPEAVLEGQSLQQSDIFSVAVILFEMLTNKLPFSGKLEECRSKSAYLKTRYTPSYELNPLVPVWLDGAIKKALRFEHNQRHGDVSELLYEIEHPNPKYKNTDSTSLLDEHPSLPWQVLSGVLFIGFCVSVYFNLNP